MRAYLVDGPRAGSLVTTDGSRFLVPIPQAGVSFAVTAEPPTESFTFDVAEYRITPLTEPDGETGADAIGTYLPPPLVCGHSRDHGPDSVYRAAADIGSDLARMPEYHHYMPKLCPTCGLWLKLEACVYLVAEAEEWLRWRRERVAETLETFADRE